MRREVYDPDIIEDSITNHTDENSESLNNSENRGFFKGIASFFSDARIRLLLGSVIGLIGVYLLIVLVSFLNNGAADQSIIAHHTSVEIASGTEDVENSGGSFGAIVADTLFNGAIGISSFIIPIWLILMSLTILKIKRFKFFFTTFASLLCIAAITMLLGYINLQFDSIMNWGGQCGRQANIFLIKLIGKVGTISVIFILLLSVLLMWFTTLSKLIVKIATSFRSSTKEDGTQEESPEEDTPRNDVAQNTPGGFEHDENKAEENLGGTLTPTEITIPTISDFTPQTDDNTEHNDIVIASEIERTDKIANTVYDPTKELSHYKFPPIDILKPAVKSNHNTDLEEQEENKQRITETLLNYGITIKTIKVCIGPTVSLFEIVPEDGIRISKIKSLEDDIALSLAALGIRIIAPIPGKGTIGIEVPNHDPQVVSMRSIIESKKYQDSKYELPLAIGCTITNEVFIADLCKMPHILVAGATGQGKSVGLNAIITSLIYRKHPAELKFVLIDPKMVEFSLYSKLEHHYLAKLPTEDDAIITDPKKVIATLNSLTLEMDNRYALLKDAKSRNIQEYNAKFVNRKLNPEKGHKYLPYIVLIVDEFSDLIMQSGKEVETPVARIAQKARAVGIHMIIATQRPSTDVITGMIKANFPGRIAFKVMQMVDSRTILDCSGAQQLIGRGDMLFLQNGELHRIQCAFIDTPEVEAICDHIDHQIGYENAYILPEYVPDSDDTNSGSFGGTVDKDVLFDEAAEFVVTSKTASTSSLQRRYSIGYNRAGKIMDQLEAAGIVGPAQGGKPRQVLIDPIDLANMLGK